MPEWLDMRAVVRPPAISALLDRHVAVVYSLLVGGLAGEPFLGRQPPGLNRFRRVR
jgi:hypothetical protein